MFRHTSARLCYLFAFLLLAGTAPAQDVAPPPPNSSVDITAADLRYHLTWLASDALEGRGTGTHALDVAAQYIANEFQRYGMKPGGDNGTWFQEFDVVTGAEAGPGNTLALQSGAMNPGWQSGREFVPISFSMNGAARGDVVFVGYGIEADKLGYNDYKNVDVKGKIVLIVSGYPDPVNPDSSLAPFASLRSKALTAREAGALAVLVFDPDSNSLAKLHYDGTAAHAGIIVMSVNHDVVNAISKACGSDLLTIAHGLNTAKKFAAFPLPNTVLSVKSDVSFVHKKTRNVIGILPGSDPARRDMFFVIGAHYDHLGWGQDGSLYRGDVPMIHHGADDNASGTAAVLELAQYFAANRPAHSVACIAFTGEEMGLLGSADWVKNPTIPLAEISAMYNLDMVGRLSDSTRRLNVQGTGTSPIWNDIVKAANTQSAFDLALIPDGQGSSDHSSFYMKDIPVLFFFTGLHSDYHRPSDVAERINFPGEEAVVRYVQRVISLSDTLRAKPAFTRVKVAENQRSRGSSVYVGTIPDFGSTSEGFKISGTSPGSPAEKANLQAGDIIVEFGATKVLSIYDYMNALSMHKAGEDVPVKVKRGNDIVTLQVHLINKK